MEFKSSKFNQQKPECKDQQTPIIAGQHQNHQTFWNSLTDTNILNILISNRFYNETILIQIQDNPNSQKYGKSESNPGRNQFFIAKTSDSTSSVSPKGVYLKKCPSSQEI